jgi:hypothetical protein
VVINSNRGGRDLDAEEAIRYEQELAAVEAELDELGISHEVRQLVRGLEPARTSSPWPRRCRRSSS